MGDVDSHTRTLKLGGREVHLVSKIGAAGDIKVHEGVQLAQELHSTVGDVLTVAEAEVRQILAAGDSSRHHELATSERI